ncbi:MAG: HD domain-containing protein [Gammaproteobacteria bacterium]|nr:HD domain-containing protein [Gammaproteobacteria bacterium]
MAKPLTSSKLRRPVYVAIATLITLLALGTYLIFSFIDGELERDLQVSEDKLSLVADSRHDAVNQWLEQQISVVRDLSRNASLQLYMTQLAVARNQINPAAAEDMYQQIYLEELLTVSAVKSGFADTPQPLQGINANVPQLGEAGLAILDASGSVLAATSAMPPFDSDMRQAIGKAIAKNRPYIRDVFLNAQQHPSMAFIAPVYAIQADDGKPQLAGLVIGVKQVGALFPLLRRGQIQTSAETLLVRAQNGSITYINPQADGTPALQRRLSAGLDQLAAAFATAHPGRFATTKRDYTGNEVLLVSRTFNQLPWVLIHKVDRDEAMAPFYAHRRFLLTTFFLVLFVITAVIIAAWRNGSSRRYRQTATQLEQANNLLKTQSTLLQTITNNVTDYIFIVNGSGGFTFANQLLAISYGMKPEELERKTLPSVFGPYVSDKISQVVATVKKEGESQTLQQALEIGGIQRNFHATYIPLPTFGKLSGQVLVVAHDITDLIAGETRRNDIKWQLISTLTKILDRHDPYSVEHSVRVTEVALSIAKRLRLDEKQQETVRLAGSLINLGKFFVPKEILTKKGPLAGEEWQQLYNHVVHAERILQDVPFDGPVVEAIVQSNECLDGSGYPKALTKDEIILPARILAVANALVAMTNPRAWRNSMPIHDALNIIHENADTKYDRRVVVTLMDIVENRGGFSWNEERSVA